jgi:hypothetical protein
MSYELWDTESANAIGEYETELAALVVVRRSIDRDGVQAAAAWSLVLEDDNGDTVAIARGADLVRSAQALVPA